MAEVQNGPIRAGFVDTRRKHNDVKRPTAGDYSSIETMRTALTAKGYKKGQLDHMTVNDMVYAVRLENDKAGIN